MLNRIKKHFNKEVKNASWLIAGRVIQMILSFLISIFTARYLGPGNFGIINYANAYVAFFTAFCTLGINSIIIKDFVEHPEEQGTAIGTTLVLRFLASVLSTIAIIATVSIIDHGEPTTITATALCSVALVFQIFDTLNYWFQARYESKVTAIATLFAYLATSVYKIVLLVEHKDILWFAFATSVDFIFLAIFLISAYIKHHGPYLRFSWQKGKYLLQNSYHYILSGMMVAIYGQTDKFMLKQMLSDTVVGYYSLATSINNMWVFVLTAIIDSLYPTIMYLFKEKDIQAFNRKNRQLYALVIYISIFVAIMFLLFGRFAIVLIYGKAYEPAAMPLNIVAWYTIFSYLGVARNAWIVCYNDQKYLKYIYFSAAIINILLNLWLIPIWGASGAALASLLTQIMTSMILPYFIKDLRPNVRLMWDALLLRGVK